MFYKMHMLNDIHWNVFFCEEYLIIVVYLFNILLSALSPISSLYIKQKFQNTCTE